MLIVVIAAMIVVVVVVVVSCDDNHVCQDNAGPGQPCGPDANGIDCVADWWCRTYNPHHNADWFHDDGRAYSECVDHYW